MLRDVLFLLLILAVPFGIGVYLIVGGPGSEHAVRFAKGAVKNGWLARGLGGLVAFALVGAIGWSLWSRSVTPGRWREFAQRAGLSYESGSGLGEVVGIRAGRDVHLSVKSHTDIHRRERSTWTELSVRPTGTPDGLSIVRRIDSPQFLRDLTARFSEAMGVPGTVATDDGEFDREYAVRATDATAAKEWLTPDRRNTLRQLLSNDGFLMTNSALAFQSRYPMKDLPVLEERLGRLEDCAESLERGGAGSR